MNEDNKLDISITDDDWAGTAADTFPSDSDWSFKAYDNRIDVSLDCETAERITISTLKHHLEMIYVREHDHKVNCAFYHEDDKEYDRKLKKSIRRVLKYFGEEE